MGHSYRLRRNGQNERGKVRGTERRRERGRRDGQNERESRRGGQRRR